ncbi:unnamed protein product [Hermetia illucens]|uniref:Uncharacterized protein n=1 Tax=Hermetia illucens TaxID=343691 RepID=A0A7R8UN97_HERIL|nr:uncharacterized protein LOC119651781 [Hermetia illucens]CAD7083830.1 unnamed protein product [Hermetia illucens]
MRAAVIILGLFVLTITQPSQGDIVDDVEKTIEKAIAKANNELDDVISLLKDISDISGKADNIISGGKSQLSSSISSIESMIRGLVVKASCVQSASSEITQLEDVMAKNFVICRGNLAEALSKFEENIQGDITNLRSNVAQLTGLVELCSENAVEAMFCVATKVAALEGLIGSTVASAKVAIKLNESRMAPTLKDIEKCTTKAISLATPKINQITTAVQQCV